MKQRIVLNQEVYRGREIKKVEAYLPRLQYYPEYNRFGHDANDKREIGFHLGNTPSQFKAGIVKIDTGDDEIYLNTDMVLSIIYTAYRSMTIKEKVYSIFSPFFSKVYMQYVINKNKLGHIINKAKVWLKEKLG
jgi:hypothetical protein